MPTTTKSVTIALIKMAADAGLIPADLAETVRNAYRDYRRMQHGLRLNGTKARVAPEEVGDRVTAVRELWRWVFGERSTVTQADC